MTPRFIHFRNSLFTLLLLLTGGLPGHAQPAPKINAALVTMRVGGQFSKEDKYQALLPFDDSKYHLLRTHLDTFFRFAGRRESEILALSMERISDGRFNGVLLRDIEGFTIDTSGMNKFELNRNKQAIIDSLDKAYRRYKSEYDLFLGDTFTFVVCSGDTGASARPARQAIPGFVSFWPDQSPTVVMFENYNNSGCYVKAEAKDYNIDHQTLNVRPLGFQWPSYGATDWRLNYKVAPPAGQVIPAECIFILGRGQICGIDIPLPAAKAELLFGDGGPAYFNTVVTGRPFIGTGAGDRSSEYPELAITSVRRIFKKRPTDGEPVIELNGPWTRPAP